MSPASADHGDVAMEIGYALKHHVKRHGLGKVFAAETGFVLARHPDTVRAPDAAFVRAERLPPRGRRGFFEGPPDLAVEVVSPGDAARAVAEKVTDWLDAGTRMVWVVEPEQRRVQVHQPDAAAVMLGERDVLEGGDVVAGFRLPVAEIFDNQVAFSG